MDPSTPLAVVLGGAFAVLGAAKVAKAPSMVARAEHVGFSVAQYQLIGLAELACATGLVAGLVFSPLGYSAGTGLLALMAGALATHARRDDRLADMAPAALFAAGSVAYLVLLGGRR